MKLRLFNIWLSTLKQEQNLFRSLSGNALFPLSIIISSLRCLFQELFDQLRWNTA